MLSWRDAEIKDPPGSGNRHPRLHGSLEWPAAGAIFGGGVSAGGNWIVGAEIGLRRSQSVPIVEQEAPGHFELVQLSSIYTDRERLYSVVARRHYVNRHAVLQPLVGLTVSRRTQTLTDRRGTYQWYGGTVPTQRPDVMVSTVKPGIVGGADVMFPTPSGLAITAGARLHWIKRAKYNEYTRQVPHAGPYVFSFSGGIAWQPRLRARN